MSLAYRISLEPVSPGVTSESGALKYDANAIDVTPLNPEIPSNTVIRASAAQILGLMRYIAIIKYGATTTTVETAIAAALP